MVSPQGNVLSSFSRERIGIGAWLIKAEYKSPTEDRQTNDAAFSFTTGGGTQKITHSRSTVSMTGGITTDSSGNQSQFIPTNYHGSIGNTGTLIEGVEIDLATFDFKTTFYVDPKNMTEDYVKLLKNSTATVNSDTVNVSIDGVSIGFQPGELKLRGSEGSKRQGKGDWELTVNWAASANATNLMVGDVTVPAKNGWDYLWVKSTTDVDPNTNVLTQVIQQANVEVVYQYNPLSGVLQNTAFGQGNTQFWASPAQVSGGGVTGQ